MSDLIVGVNLSASLEKSIIDSLPSSMKFESRGLSTNINFAEKKYDLLQAIVLQGKLESLASVLRELKSYWRLRHADIVWIGEVVSFRDLCLMDYLGVRLQFKSEPNLEEVLKLSQRWLQSSKQKHHVTRLELQFIEHLNTTSPTDPFSDDALQKISNLNTWYHRYKILYAHRLLQKQEWEKASRLLEDLLKRYPYFLDAQVLYAQSLLHLQKEKLAADILIKIDTDCQSIFAMQSEDLRTYVGFKEQSPLSSLAKEIEASIEEIKSELFYEVFSESILKNPHSFSLKDNKFNRKEQALKDTSGLYTKHQSLTTYQNSPLLSLISLNNLLSGAVNQGHVPSPSHKFTSMDFYQTKVEKNYLLIMDDVDFCQNYLEKLESTSEFDLTDLMEISDKLRVNKYRILFVFFKNSLESYNLALESLLLIDDVELLPVCILYSKEVEDQSLGKVLEKHHFYEGFYPLPTSKEELLKMESSCKESFDYQGGFKRQIKDCRKLAMAAKLGLRDSSLLVQKLRDIWNSSISEEKKILLLADSCRIFAMIDLDESWVHALESHIKVKGVGNLFLKKLAWITVQKNLNSKINTQKLVLEQLFSEAFVNCEKMYVVAKILLEDANPSGLHKLLEHWIHTDKLPKNICFELVFISYLLDQNFSGNMELVVLENSLERYASSFDLNFYLQRVYLKLNHLKISEKILERLVEKSDSDLQKIRLLAFLSTNLKLSSIFKSLAIKLKTSLSF